MTLEHQFSSANLVYVTYVSLCNTLLLLPLSQKKAAQFLLFGVRNPVLFPQKGLSLSLFLAFHEWVKSIPPERRENQMSVYTLVAFGTRDCVCSISVLIEFELSLCYEDRLRLFCSCSNDCFGIQTASFSAFTSILLCNHITSLWVLLLLLLASTYWNLCQVL